MSHNRMRMARGDLGALIAALSDRGYRILGPTVGDGAIIYDELESDTDLPVGWGEDQSPGAYRLVRRQDQAVFGFTLGPHTWKKFLYPAEERLFQVTLEGMSFQPEAPAGVKQAFFGVRACERQALSILDRVFLENEHVDSGYAARRRDTFIVAVNCTTSSPACFCASMGTGPEHRGDFDLCLTELLTPKRHDFLVEAGSAVGEAIMKEVPHCEADEADVAQAEKQIEATAKEMSRSMDGDNAAQLLSRNLEHPRWHEVADRCLSCANCTMVCPTCFCSTVEDTTDLTGDHAERWRRWDSCFNQDFSYAAGGHARSSTMSRYRQWLTHKLSGWHEQFGTSGCVGCGRCITWCPVGIDLTEEVAAIRAADGAVAATSKAEDCHA